MVKGVATARQGMSKVGGKRRSAAGDSRLDRQAWIDAACRVLTEQGVDQVRILPLAERLGVTRGSFYWHFKSRAALLDELVALWNRKNTRALIEAATRPARDFPERIFWLARCWLGQSDYNPRFDIAMRDWARRDKRIFRLVRQADEERIAAIATLFEAKGEGARMAFIRARVIYYMQMGYYIVGVREPMETRVGYLREYYLAFTGEPIAEDRARAITAALMAGQPIS
jgi:AcrR family transcriptional regulator